MGKGLMCTHHLMTSLGQINLLQYRQNPYLSKLMYFFFQSLLIMSKQRKCLMFIIQEHCNGLLLNNYHMKKLKKLLWIKFFLEPTIRQLASLWLVLLLLISLLIDILI